MNTTTLKGRIATLALGHTMDQIITRSFNYVLYPVVMHYFGAVLGTVVIIVLSFILCLATMKFYDWSKTDWLGIEMLKQVREEEGSGNRFSRALSWALRKGEFAVLLILSVYKDSFVTTVYMRKGANEYGGMSTRDWKIFISSLIISCLWWSFIVNLTMAGVKAFFIGIYD